VSFDPQEVFDVFNGKPTRLLLRTASLERPATLEPVAVIVVDGQTYYRKIEKEESES
jgi:hypothetical protein